MAYKKSIKEKKDSGTYNVTRERGKSNIEPVADITSIKKPDFLDKNAGLIWDFAVSQLSEGHVKTIDIGIFSRWCSLFSDFCQITQAISEAGLVAQDEETGPVTRNSVIVPDKEEDAASAFLELLNN